MWATTAVAGGADRSSGDPMSTDRDRLRVRIAALRAKTLANGCTEAEVLAAAAKVADLLERYALSMSDVEIQASPCIEAAFETARKKRVPLDGCVGAVAVVLRVPGVARERASWPPVRVLRPTGGG